MTAFERQDADLSEAFKQECRTLRRIRHRNILRFYGAGTARDGRLFALTELMSLGSLRHVLDSDAKLTAPMQHSIALQVS